MSRASGDASSAAVAGSPKACTTSGGRWRAGWGGAGVSMLFSHEGLEALTTRSDGNDGTRRGIRPRVGLSPPGPISGHPDFWSGIAVTVQFGHWDGGLGVCAWAGGGVPGVGAHALRVRTTEAVLKEGLENDGQSASLSKGQGSDDKVGRDRRFRDRDCTTCPTTYRWIHTVILVHLPKSKREGFQQGRGVVVGDVVMLCLDTEFREVEVFSPGTRPIGGEYAGVCARRLSIKLNGQRENGDEDVGVEKTLHFQGACEQRCLGKVLVFREGEEGAMEVAVGEEYCCVLARVGAKREDAGNGR